MGFRRSLRVLVLAVVGGSLLAAADSQAQEEDTRESFTARALSMGTVAPGAHTTLQITIDRWSTDEERNELIAAIVEQGPEELLDKLQDQEETGFVRVSGRGSSTSTTTSP